jgi:hypothetical protein
VSFSSEILLEAVTALRVFEKVLEDIFRDELPDGDVEVLMEGSERRKG